MPALAPLARPPRPTTVAFSVLALLAVLTHPSPVQTAHPAATPACRPTGRVIKVPELREGSGVAVSRHDPRRAWAHNDSGRPVLVSLNDQGVVTGQLELTGARVEDWEAMAIGPCAAGSCLYIGDIGDNDAERKRITIYRVPEPAGTTRSVVVRDVFHATYPDGAHDAEALLVTPKGDIYIVTKGDTGPVAVYRFPPDIRNGTTVELIAVGQPRDDGPVAANDRITDGAVSPDGAWVALRTNTEVRFHRAADLLSGNWREAGRIDVATLGEPQGEGIAFADDETLYLVGEGGGNSQPGTFARLICTF